MYCAIFKTHDFKKKNNVKYDDNEKFMKHNFLPEFFREMIFNIAKRNAKRHK